MHIYRSSPDAERRISAAGSVCSAETVMFPQRVEALQCDITPNASRAIDSRWNMLWNNLGGNGSSSCVNGASVAATSQEKMLNCCSCAPWMWKSIKTTLLTVILWRKICCIFSSIKKLPVARFLLDVYSLIFRPCWYRVWNVSAVMSVLYSFGYKISK